MRVARTKEEAGFTLVELMVVIVIMGLLAAVAVLALPPAGGSLRAEAERMAARAKAAQESALIESRATALQVDAAGYAVSRTRDGAWQEVGRFPWNPGTRPDLAGAGLRTVFDATGGADPLALTLRNDDQRVQVRIDDDGAISILR